MKRIPRTKSKKSGKAKKKVAAKVGKLALLVRRGVPFRILQLKKKGGRTGDGGPEIRQSAKAKAVRRSRGHA